MTDIKPRTLILLRHGDPDPQEGLTQKGVLDVQKSAQSLVMQGLVPDMIVSSHPLRAQKTTQTLKDEFAKAIETIDHDLLNVHTENFCAKNFLSDFSQDSGIILLSGHGETIAVFLNDLLDDENCAHLFSCAPDDRTIKTAGADSSSIVSLIPRTADGVVLIQESGQWRFYAYLADGNVFFAKSEENTPKGIKASNSFLLSYRLT